MSKIIKLKPKTQQQPDKPKEPCCGTCVHGSPLPDNADIISCRAHPPAVTSVIGNTINSHWPLLGKERICGEHKPR